MAERPLRVVVCGTTFGQVYLEGLRHAGPDLELVGILAHGSRRSVQCAEHYGVPLYSDPRELPSEVDAACVVVRSGLLGGSGAELARTLMARGIHVIQEHPLHHDELVKCLQTARSAGVVYQLNSFYPHVLNVRSFIAAAHELQRHTPALYIDAACGFQLAYSLLDILGNVLSSVRPWRLAPRSATVEHVRRPGEDVPFQSIDGVIGAVPMTLRIQNQMDPGDPDNHAHIDHRITIGTDGGNLTLLNTHGPIVLSRRPRYPHAPRDPSSAPYFEERSCERSAPSATVIGPYEPPGFREMFESHWPPAVRHALEQLRAAIITGENPLLRGHYHLSLCRLWQEVTASLGPPELIRREAPGPLSAEAVEAIVRAGTQLEAVA
ncbi:MAG TPA: Gfo/Idh/MocA family oxidoreductase [Solirubrobacteraceae bacterium]|nr:Gfo/Idh/MocA family oxidoreductase [Solirubrobacteraceae bacterium]